ncbi:hypothetical protein [Rhodococcus daqingensis]|uniref:Molecular chaperone n=1 Tax=Rhodococcus daqingensis TaxID=2479363 RepID=A0ABW2S215_9NOCA
MTPGIGLTIGTTDAVAATRTDDAAPGRTVRRAAFAGEVPVGAAVRCLLDEVRTSDPAVRTAGVVLTYPAVSTEHTVVALREALDADGFVDVELVAEPTAAVAWLAADRGTLDDGLVLVYHLGGSSLDICLVAVGPHCGHHPIVGRPLRSTQFETQPTGQSSASVDLIRDCLQVAGAVPADLQYVLLTGGAAEIPLAGGLIAEELNVRVICGPDPAATAARGAAILASRFSEIATTEVLRGTPRGAAGVSVRRKRWRAAVGIAAVGMAAVATLAIPGVVLSRGTVPPSKSAPPAASAPGRPDVTPERRPDLPPAPPQAGSVEPGAAPTGALTAVGYLPAIPRQGAADPIGALEQDGERPVRREVGPVPRATVTPADPVSWPAIVIAPTAPARSTGVPESPSAPDPATTPPGDDERDGQGEPPSPPAAPPEPEPATSPGVEHPDSVPAAPREPDHDAGSGEHPPGVG